MSETEKLKKEIEYFSVLIQKHKEKTTSKSIDTNPSKYRWSKDGRTVTNTRAITGTASHNQSNLHIRQTLQTRKRPLSSIGAIGSVQQRIHSKPCPKTTPVVFDPKYKWKKDLKRSTQPAVNPHSSSKVQVSVPSPITISSTTANPLVFTTVCKSSKYKYHKNAITTESSSAIPTTSVSRDLLPKVQSGVPFAMSGGRKLSPSGRYVYKSKRYSNDDSRSRGGRDNPYKLRRNRRIMVSPNNMKSLAKFNKSRGNKKVYIDKRKRTCDSATHITLSKAALEDLLKKHSISVKQSLANKAVVKSHETSRTRKRSVDGKRQYCLYFGRFGKCMRGDSCKFIHDPSKIAVCTRFLRGTCRDSNCSFSHKVEKEKIPLCLFFLRGKCTVPDCPYLHVYLGKDAPVCKRFASTGFCPNGEKCKEQHIKCCPEFFESGKCQRGQSCDLSHFKLKRPSVKKSCSAEGSEKRDISNSASGTTANVETSTEKRDIKLDPGFLSLKVDSPAPINRPVRKELTLIKPRFGKLKTKISSSQ